MGVAVLYTIELETYKKCDNKNVLHGGKIMQRSRPILTTHELMCAM